MDFQASTNSLRAHWVIPDEKHLYVNDIYWAVDERAPVAGKSTVKLFRAKSMWP